MKDVVILSAARTPIGSFLGALSSLPAPKLGAVAIKAAVERAGIDPESIDQVLMGCVLQGGLGQAPARQAMIYAGLPKKAGAITVHKVCGSGLRSVMDAANGIRVGEWSTCVAGGMESMSLAPHILHKARTGFRMGEAKLADAMIHDGLWDPYGDKHMGNCAELCVKEYKLTRDEQDAFALTSYKRAQAAVEAGKFDDELAPVEVPQRKKDPIKVVKDEEPFAAPLEKMPKLRPAFDKEGTVTAANASKINDGAAALVVCSEEQAKAAGKKPLVRLVSQGGFAQEPDWFTTAPAKAAQVALDKAGLKVADIDRWEINEAFAAVAMAAMRDLELDPAKVNARGGAVALGHPIGCSGARILTTLIHTLVQEKLRYGCASICLGGGEAVSVIVENATL
ncbi:MAG: acetyl-CoA C-acyltransferase [Deltaproteobacteria bacterium]|jgi:acetyl-CoA C-acetyltransferase|nr:acetyl-CoA C-acyltransferase [Deltaproteobacteria bacterium]MBW2531614.1 acetyl-CoA C-acyltransferase [Deltaproteobacteria bacterium]